MAGIPHMAGGSSVGQFTKQVAEAIAKYKRLYGKAPSPDEVKGLEQYVTSLSRPTSKGIPTNPQRLAATTPAQNHLVDEAGNAYRAVPGPYGLTTPEKAGGYSIDPFANTGANFRAREGLYDPSVKAFESRDPFLTQAMTGRPPSGTYQKPFTVNVDDLHAQQAAQEAKGSIGAHTGTGAGERPAQSITPSADYFADMAAAVENKALPDNLVSVLRQKLGRNPTEDEINALIADLNVLNMDYTGKGATAFGFKPTMPKGRPTKAQEEEIAKWRQFGIDSGQARSAVEASGSDLKSRYPSLQREVEWGPESGMKMGGSVTPEQMRHMMLATGKTPSKFAGGGKAKAALKNYGAPIAMNVPFLAGDLSEIASNVKNKKYADAAEGAIGLGLDYLPYTPLTVALGNLRPSQLGDATLDTWNARKQQESLDAINRGFSNFEKASPANKKVKPSDAAVLKNIFPVQPEPETDYLSGFRGFETK